MRGIKTRSWITIKIIIMIKIKFNFKYQLTILIQYSCFAFFLALESRIKCWRPIMKVLHVPTFSMKHDNEMRDNEWELFVTKGILDMLWKTEQSVQLRLSSLVLSKETCLAGVFLLLPASTWSCCFGLRLISIMYVPQTRVSGGWSAREIAVLLHMKRLVYVTHSHH